MEPFATGGQLSEHDPRTVQTVTTGVPLTSGGMIYAPEDHEHQHKVGICTAIHLTQNRAKVNSKKYSADFQYLIQKKEYDGDWGEGSSILNALKVGKNIGFLPLELWTWTTEEDRYLPYYQYIAKLQAIPDAEIARLKALCVDNIKGYAYVDPSNPQAIAKAIEESEGGVLTMVGCGDTWWIPSWLPKDINPLRKPTPFTSYHAIGTTYFDFSRISSFKHANSWGKDWCDNGNADVDFVNYKPIEVWTILRETPVIKPVFSVAMNYGENSLNVKALQQKLTDLHYFTVECTGYYGEITRQAVLQFQIEKCNLSWFERYVLRGKKVGQKTLSALNNN